MNFLTWLDSHKTKIVGFFIVLLGYIQTNSSTIQPLLSPKAFGWVMFAVGGLVMAFGFINSSKDGGSGDSPKN